MENGEVRINLKNIDKKDIGEYIITNGLQHRLYSPYGNQDITIAQLKVILREHSDIAYADLAYALLCG